MKFETLGRDLGALRRGIRWRVIRDTGKPARMTYHEFIGNLCSFQGISAARSSV